MRFDFDDISEWGPRLATALETVVQGDVRDRLADAGVEFIEDAFGILMAAADPAQLAQATRSWLEGQVVIAYHGSRLSEDEVASVLAHGLQPLVPWRRRERLASILARHEDWHEAEHRLDATMADFGDGAFGRREGQAHLTISRGSLLTAFNHYLVEGSEFDQAVAVELLGKSARPLLQEGRKPVLFTVAVPGERALEVGERFATAGEMSGLVRHVLQFWSFWLHDPSIRPGTQHVDFGLIFHEGVPPDWILGVTEVDEAELLLTYRH